MSPSRIHKHFVIWKFYYRDNLSGAICVKTLLTTPKLKESVFSDSLPFRRYSGAMYGVVPIRTIVCVEVLRGVDGPDRVMPKSPSFARIASSNKMLALKRSQFHSYGVNLHAHAQGLR